MNITSATPKDFSGLNNLTNNTLDSLSDSSFTGLSTLASKTLADVNLSNSTLDSLNYTALVVTKTIISALDSVGGRKWDLKYYWIFIVPFALTVPFFLVAGDLLRWSIRSAATYAIYWRNATLLLAPVGFVGFYWALPWFGGFPVFIVYAIFIYGGFGLFATLRFWLAFRSQRGRRLWTSFFCLVAVSCCMDGIIFVPFGIPVFMLFPWAFLLWTWSRQDNS